MDELRETLVAAQALSGPASAYLWAKAIGAWVEIIVLATFWTILVAGSSWVCWRICTVNREGE